MKKFVMLSFFIIFLCTSYSQDSLASISIQPLIEDSINNIKQSNLPIKVQDSVLIQAFSFKGTPYKVGGMSQQGMDCSGLICKSFGALNLKLPHSSGELSKLGTYVEADSLQVGDLVFFKGRSINTPSVGHVAMVSKVVDGLIYIIHATNSRGVIEEVLQKNSYFMDRWLFNKRIIE